MNILIASKCNECSWFKAKECDGVDVEAVESQAKPCEDFTTAELETPQTKEVQEPQEIEKLQEIVQKPKKSKRGRKPVPENETKAERFKRLANARLVKIQENLESISKLGNKGNYDYTAEQVEHIKTALYKAVDDAVSRLNHKKTYYQL